MNVTSMLAASLLVLSTPGGGGAQQPGQAADAGRIGLSDAGACDDLLARVGRKPTHLEFLGCRHEKVHGFAALVADYQVEGRSAAAIERYFVQSANMPAAGFYCCGWETLGQVGQLRHDGVVYDVAMASGETLLNQRADWPKIAWFRVTVTRFLEEP